MAGLQSPAHEHCPQVPSQPPRSPDIPILRYGILENLQETFPRATSTTCSMNSKTLMTWERAEPQSARAALQAAAVKGLG